MRLVIRNLDRDFKPIQGKSSFYGTKCGYADVADLQTEMFQRHTGPGIDNRLIRNIRNGIELVEFTCSNFGYRDYDHGDYMIRSITRITLEN